MTKLMYNICVSKKKMMFCHKWHIFDNRKYRLHTNFCVYNYTFVIYFGNMVVVNVYLKSNLDDLHATTYKKS